MAEKDKTLLVKVTIPDATYRKIKAKGEAAYRTPEGQAAVILLTALGLWKEPGASLTAASQPLTADTSVMVNGSVEG